MMVYACLLTDTTPHSLTGEQECHLGSRAEGRPRKETKRLYANLPPCA